MFMRFDGSSAEFQFVEQGGWLHAFGINYHMGVDGISMFFVLLSAALTPVCILSAWDVIKTRVREFMIAFLVLESLMIGTFCALDMVLFYVFFEGVLIPMFLIIGVWGGARRVYSAYKFFLYTLLGSVLMLVALLVMYAQAGTTDIPTLMETNFARDLQILALVSVFCVLCRENADVAGAYLAARCACGGADGGVGYSGRCVAEDGRIWLPALFSSHVPGCKPVLHADGVRPERRSDHLHFSSRTGAGR